ncbi:MAG: DUF308 domain-containing protein [Methanoregulaceae archaeon]|nr:DUF308 domain-containing protein [Methanoregulaceae archaeon]MCU0628056.1 DUF308 domain-containing protein [Methanoregulaceae archaeon]
MAKLDDFLGPLHQGVWEVIVPRAEVTEPPGPEWKISSLNVPSPETIASYRKGQYHAHETEQDYRIHMDRYDPEKNPIMHLVDDAPLVLMLYDTMDTLVVRAKDAKSADYAGRLADQNLTWKMRMATGAGLMIAGVLLLLFAIGYPGVFYAILIPLFICAFGVILLIAGFRQRARKEYSRKDLILGVTVLCTGLLMFMFWPFFVFLLLAVLALWFLSSAYVSLRRVMREKTAIPQGVWITIGMGIGSFVLGVLAFVNPAGLLKLLILLLAVLTLLGAVLSLIDGFGLRNAAKLMEAHHAASHR